MPYSPLLVRPMTEELTSIGFTELLTAEDVDRANLAGTKGLTLLFFNSVKGSAAGMGRPGVRQALENAPKRPDRLLTVFAEHDLDATARARSLFPDIPPSDPSIALFKDGDLIHFIPSHRIEGRDAGSVATELTGVFEEFAG
ncbi:BrxA/BrxB family bacilliredoxin [Streptomyces sp. NPDC005435]|uniref:BrxA/BrxB family bacilliredoxin n=1 Tax=Streptomyces sp. NPDC005435 TaxID=3154464 RepID=UPI003452E23E